MSYMNSGRFVWVAGVLGGMLACSGRYEVGKLANGGASGAGSEVAAGGAFTITPIFVGYAGAASAAGGADVVSGGATTAGVGPGNPSAGAGSGAPPPSYCGSAIPVS